MEVGEPVNVPVAGIAGAKEWKFRAEILEVTFKSDVQVTRGKTLIAPPHWKKGEDMKDVWSEAKKMGLPEDAGYSKRAAAMLIQGTAGAQQGVELKVHVTESENVSAQGDLLGRFGGLEITGKLPLAAGEHVITAQIKTLPETVSWYRGGIDWGVSIADPGVSITLGSSTVEVFFIPAVPVAPFKAGVWAEALRFLCNKVGVVGLKTPIELARKITYYCHTVHGLTYDTMKGKAHYGDPQERRFELTSYMQGDEPGCNCFDQASAVQVLMAVLGVRVPWLFMFGFGYIQTANLVGIGACNNPFYPTTRSEKIVAPLSPKRTAFDCHSFCEQDAKILDACVEPHLGTETRKKYLDNTIDYTPELYPPNIQPGAGRGRDIEKFLPMINVV